MTRMNTPVAQPDAITFDKAVDVAKRIIRERLDSLTQPDPVSWLVVRCLVNIKWGADNPFSVLDCLLSSSTEDRVAYDCLPKIAANLRRDGRPLPDQLERWTIEYLDGNKRPPGKKRARDASRDLIRNAGIRQARYALSDRGMDDARAADAVADAVYNVETERKGSRARFSRSAFDKVWQSRDKQFDDWEAPFNDPDIIWVEGRGEPTRIQIFRLFEQRLGLRAEEETKEADLFLGDKGRQPSEY